MSQSKDKLVSFAPLSKAIPGTLMMESMLLSKTRSGWLQGVYYTKGQDCSRDRAAHLTGQNASHPWRPDVHKPVTLDSRYYFAWATITKNDILSTLQQKCIAHSSGGWKSEIRMPAWSGLGKSSLPGSEMAIFSLSVHFSLACAHRGGQWGEKSGVSSSSYKTTTNPIRFRPHLLTSFNFNYILKALSLHTVKLGVEVPTYELGCGRGGEDMQFSP